MPGTPALATGSATPNNGVFTLTWTASTDTESDPITYTLQHKDADDASFSNVASGISGNSYAFTSGSKEGNGTWSYRVQASDGSLSSSFSSASSAIKSDRSGPNAPVVSTSPASPAYTDGSSNNWWKDTVTVTFAWVEVDV